MEDDDMNKSEEDMEDLPEDERSDEEERSEEEESNEDDDEITKLKKRILRERREHYKSIQLLEKERNNVHEAKSTISQLISQITEYKHAIEEEKAELENELMEKEEDVEKEKLLAVALQQSVEKLEAEKQSLVDQISRLEQIHEEALEVIIKFCFIFLC
jgi:hypothetical protein